jgi:hypothetical protein
MARAVAMICDAVRLDFARFLGEQVEGRLRTANAHARMERRALMRLRYRLEDELNNLVAASERPVRELRRALDAASPAEPEDAEARLAAALGPLVEAATRGVLGDFRIEPEGLPEPRYLPSETLLWAWRQLRAIEGARNVLADKKVRPLRPTFEVACFLPEALPADEE